MRRQSSGSRILHRNSGPDREAGFTLVEVLVALALVTILGAVGVSAVGAAARAIARGTEEARWNASVALLDTAARRALSGFPPAFWARPPEIESSQGEYRIVDRGDAAGYTVSFRLLEAGRKTLLVSYGPTRVAIAQVTSFTLSPLRTTDGRIGGITLFVTGSTGRTAELKISFGGQYL